MSTSDKFEQVIGLIDAQNNQDPNLENTANGAQPKELLYAQRMTEKLLQFEPNASEQVQIAARAQHICRWKIARNTYPMDRVGYLKWRQDLKKFHADLTASLLQQVGYDADFIARVSFLIEKKLNHYTKYQRIKILRKYQEELRKSRPLQFKDWCFFAWNYFVNLNSTTITEFFKKRLSK